jgi:hypothetical protein
MAYDQPGTEVSVGLWNEQVRGMGINDTSAPELNERRIFSDGSNGYILKFYDGTEWKPVTNVTFRTSAGEVLKAHIQCDIASVGAAMTTISFPDTFTEVYAVLVTIYYTNASYPYMVETRNMTINSIRVVILGTDGTAKAGSVSYVAIGKL